MAAAKSGRQRGQEQLPIQALPAEEQPATTCVNDRPQPVFLREAERCHGRVIRRACVRPRYTGLPRATLKLSRWPYESCIRMIAWPRTLLFQLRVGVDCR